MFPNKKQYNNWTLPSKYSLWGFIIGIISLALAIYALFPNKSILESIAEEEYKPNIKITNIKSLNWAGYENKYLTIYFKNISKGPAENFKLSLFLDNEKISLSKPTPTPVLLYNNLKVKPNKEIALAVYPMYLFKSLLKNSEHNGEIIGFSLNSELPNNIKEMMESKYIKNGIGRYSVKSTPIFIKYSYNGIADTKSEVSTGFYVFIDDTHQS